MTADIAVQGHACYQQAVHLHTVQSAQVEPLEVKTVAAGATLCLHTWPFSEDGG